MLVGHDWLSQLHCKGVQCSNSQSVTQYTAVASFHLCMQYAPSWDGFFFAVKIVPLFPRATWTATTDLWPLTTDHWPHSSKYQVLCVLHAACISVAFLYSQPLTMQLKMDDYPTVLNCYGSENNTWKLSTNNERWPLNGRNINLSGPGHSF